MFRIELSFTSTPDRGWLTRVLFSAVAHGIRFNSGGFEGSYRVIPTEPSDEIVVTESGELERTDMLVDAVEAYMSFDQESAELAMMTTYTDENSNIPCSIQLTPHTFGYVLSFGTNQKEMESIGDLTSFVGLPKAIFERFDFVYGASQVDEQQHIPTTIGDAQGDHPRAITFYSSELVNKIGRKELLSSPAAVVSELSNEGIFMLASAELPPNGEQVQSIREHLNIV